MSTTAGPVGVALLTRDLRVEDNPVLAGAAQGCARVVPLHVLDGHDRRSPAQRSFVAGSLRDLDGSLRRLGAALVVRRGRTVEEAMRVVHEVGARELHVAGAVTRDEQRRVRDLGVAARRHGLEVRVHAAPLVVQPSALPRTYRVFTPYHRRWLAAAWRAPEPAPRSLALPEGLATGELPAEHDAFAWEGGERAARSRLERWLRDGLAAYASTRDLAAEGATSRLSSDLAIGCLSPLEVASRCAAAPGGEAFVRQLCWRDFFAQLLAAQGELEAHSLRAEPRWNEDERALSAWREGRTGYPVVDASMRQLGTEGFLPNRNRMVVASFLTRDLLVDWRRGAEHFRAHLRDFDVASNQLSWQWVAGTGGDANPHRVLSPLRQRDRVDPDGTYVARWLRPEDLARPPIVEHAAAIEAWRAAMRAGSTGQHR